jgi:hemerythrin
MTLKLKSLGWNEEYSVGVPLLDIQHKEILETIQIVSIHEHDHDHDLKSVSSNVFSDSINRLTALMADHILDEENYLLQHKYPDFDDHKKSHLKLMDGYSELLYKLTKDEKDAHMKLVEFLRTWWVGHIVNEDMKFKNHFETAVINNC